MRLSELSPTPTLLDGVFVGVRFCPDTTTRLADLQSAHAIPNPLAPTDFHVTLVYSRKPLYWRPEPDVGQEARVEGWEVFEARDGKRCLVLLLDSPYLHKRFKLAMSRGASYDYDAYRPHITLSYDVGEGFDHTALPVPDFPIVMVNEYVQSLHD